MPVTRQQWSTTQSSPVLYKLILRHALANTEVPIVHKCRPVESMQYIFPMNLQKKQKNSPTSPGIFSFLFEVTTASPSGLIGLQFSLKRAGRVITSQYSRLRHVQTSSNHKIFLCFRQWRTEKEKKKKNHHHLHRKLVFCALVHVGIGLIHSLAAYIHCCCCFSMECSDFSLHHDTV